MVWDSCNIAFHNRTNGIFYTSDIVTGTIILDIKKKCRINNITVSIKGISKALWSRPSPTIPYLRIYSEKREVFNIMVDIFDDIKHTTIESGLLSRQFHFILPSDLPPTYKDSIAKVYYKITVKSNTDWTTKMNKNYFTVMNYVELNNLGEYKDPIIHEISKTFRDNKLFAITLKTKNAFLSTQILPFEAIISNEKKVNVNKIGIALIQKLNYNVSSGYSTREKVLCKSYFTDLLNIACQTCYFKMAIPNVTPSTINVDNPIVDISYLLRVKVDFRFHFALYTEIPVTIGTYLPRLHS